jgi:hypothetical protein
MRGNELVAGIDVGAPPDSTFQRTCDPGGMLAPFIGYQFGSRFAFTPFFQPALFTFATAVDQDRDSDVTSILAGTAGGRFSLFDENKEIYFTVQGGYYNDMSGPINDHGEGFNFTGGFNYDFWNGTALGLFIRRDQSSMRAARNSTKDLQFLVAGLSLRHRFLAPPPAPAPAIAALPAPPPRCRRGKEGIVPRRQLRLRQGPDPRRRGRSRGDATLARRADRDLRDRHRSLGTDRYNERLSFCARHRGARLSGHGRRCELHDLRGFGESQPVPSNDRPRRAENRRIDALIGSGSNFGFPVPSRAGTHFRIPERPRC